MADYYKVLNVSKNATPKEIRKAFLRLALLQHPDTNKRCAAQRAQPRLVELWLPHKRLEPEAQPREVVRCGGGRCVVAARWQPSSAHAADGVHRRVLDHFGLNANQLPMLNFARLHQDGGGDLFWG